MKVPTQKLILRSLKNIQCLPQLSAEETECTLKDAERNFSSQDGQIDLSSYVHMNLCSASVPTCSAASPCFKVPKGCPDYTVCHDNSLSTPRMSSRIINLSFSQPNSPKTPVVPVSKLYNRLATPRVPGLKESWLDHSALTTPYMQAALSEIRHPHETSLPDMLALIDDDSVELSQVERQLLHNTDLDLNDTTVVDYLLDVANDPLASVQPLQTRTQNYPPSFQRLTRSKPSSVEVCNGQAVTQESDGLNVRRGRRRSGKRQTAEETAALRRQRRLNAVAARQSQQRRDSRDVPQCIESTGRRRVSATTRV